MLIFMSRGVNVTADTTNEHLAQDCVRRSKGKWRSIVTPKVSFTCEGIFLFCLPYLRVRLENITG